MTAIELANAFNARLVDETRHRYPESTAHLELYHAGLSVCSQKVRTVLAELEQPYVSHELSILNSRGIYSEELTPAENYYPEYVKLRMLGAKQAGSRLASGYSGSSAVSSEGFDARVVPTLVDHEKDRVVVDSLRICEHLIDSENSTKRLLGDTERSEPISCNKHPLSTERHSPRSFTDFIQMTIEDQNSSKQKWLTPMI